MYYPELFANSMALAVFIVPLISNICIQLGTRVIYQGVAAQHTILMFCISIQFALLVSTAIACPTMKQQLQETYSKEAKSPLTSSKDTNKDLKLSPELKKQWIMAQTSSPQFVIARSVICTASGGICVLTVLVLAESVIQLYITMSKNFMFFFPSSDYEWSANVIVSVQAAAVFVGSISPISRWFTVVYFNFEKCTNSPCKDLWSVEPYWTQRLKDLKNLHLGVDPRHVKFNNFIGKGKHMALEFFTKFQNFTVVSRTRIAHESHIKKGEKKAISESQINLLKKSDGFDGIKEFNRNLIEELTKINIDGVSNNPNGSWVIRIVTLSTIVCAIKTDLDKEFVSTVTGILPLVSYVEKALDASQTDVDQDAARNMWTDVLSYKKCLDGQIKPDVSLKMKLETLTGLLKKNKEGSDQLAVTWMDETAKIVMKFLDTEMNKEEEDKVCQQMTRMVLDIIVTCLVNLERAITINISNASIEKRELVVKEAVSMCGKSQEIQEFAKQRFSTIIGSPDYDEYLDASWWKIVKPKIPLEDAIKSMTLVGNDDHLIDVESKSISKC